MVKGNKRNKPDFNDSITDFRLSLEINSNSELEITIRVSYIY